MTEKHIKDVQSFQIEGLMMRYSLFVPRLYNWCRQLGFSAGKIMPSRAFCSDESQGFPIIMLAKHFATFPFNHGQVGGIVATDRHAPHADHGKDLVIIQASHVGYDPSSRQFGTYRRLQTAHQDCTANCGKIAHAMDWYLSEYNFACENIYTQLVDQNPCLVIDNQILNIEKSEGLFLRLEQMIVADKSGQFHEVDIRSTSKVYRAQQKFVDHIGIDSFSEQPQQIGKRLDNKLFYFKRDIPAQNEGSHHLESNLIQHMPRIITSREPMLTAAQYNTQVEFDRTYRSIVKEPSYQEKNLLFIAGINIDISPQDDQFFPLTKFIPWAAFHQDIAGNRKIYEQTELFNILSQQSTENTDQVDLEEAIRVMSEVREIKISLEN